MTSSTYSDRIDGVQTSIAIKAQVVVATAADITLEGEQTIDGVAVVSGDRVLVWNQTTDTENGIYDVSTTSWERSKDFNGERDVAQGSLVWVINGNDYSSTFFQLATTDDPIVFGTSSITFTIAVIAADGFKWKNSAKAASTANLTLSAAQTVDDIPLVAGDRILVKNQTAPAENGVYVVASGAWSRAPDLNAWSEFPSAAIVVEEGTANADTAWLCSSDQGGTLETTAITWASFGETLIAGTGIAISGGAVSADPNNAVDTVITAADEIIFGDASDGNNPKKDTVQGILDLIAASSGRIISTQVFGYPTAYSDTFTTNFAGDANQLTIAGAPTQPFIIDKTAWRFTTSGTLPAGLSLATDYFIVAINSTSTIEVSETFGGSPITLTDDGTGTHTIAPLGIWTKSAGANSIIAEICGAGSGAAGVATGDVGAGGAAGGYAYGLIDVSGTSSETVIIGPGGDGGAAGTNNGTAGGTSSLGALISATGADGAVASTAHVAGANGGEGIGGDFNADGEGGGGGSGSTNAISGEGGSSHFGGGAPATGSASDGIDAGNYASGGSGANGVGGSFAGGNGSGGILVIKEIS